MTPRTAALAALALCGLAAAAHADRADQLFKKGKKLLAEKKYAEACGAFEQSDRIDPEIGAKLNVAVNAVLANPKLKERFHALGGEVMPMSSAEFGKLVTDETDKWAKVVKFAGVKVQ